MACGEWLNYKKKKNLLIITAAAVHDGVHNIKLLHSILNDIDTKNTFTKSVTMLRSLTPSFLFVGNSTCEECRTIEVILDMAAYPVQSSVITGLSLLIPEVLIFLCCLLLNSVTARVIL